MVEPECIFIVGGSCCCKVVKPCTIRLFQVHYIAYICQNVVLKHSLVVHTHKSLLVLLRGRSNMNSIGDFVLLLIVVVPLLPDDNHVVQQRLPLHSWKRRYRDQCVLTCCQFNNNKRPMMKSMWAWTRCAMRLAVPWNFTRIQYSLLRIQVVQLQLRSGRLTKRHPMLHLRLLRNFQTS